MMAESKIDRSYNTYDVPPDSLSRPTSQGLSYEESKSPPSSEPSHANAEPLAKPSMRANGASQAFLDQRVRAGHQRFVLADPVAIRYLEEDPSTILLDPRATLHGYQSYVVEQWACSRTHPTFVISAYTGDASHTIRVGVLGVPANEESWSQRLRIYFKSLDAYNTKRKDTPLGTFLVTNLATFPSSLTIILIPQGDIRKQRDIFFVAENLKRLGCSGRVGLTLSEPSSATQAKYHQLYRISDRINLYNSVIELVKLCQVSLVLFGCLGPEYADGLLCDVTEQAISEWWAQIGTDLHNIEPNDGILGPTSVAAILGTLMGARNRLGVYGAPVSKDVFDIDSTKKAIGYFQKAQRLPKSRRLDRHTLDRLHKATAKQASSEGWTVPRAVKSTVAELSGKGGEMVMDMVGRGDKANIAEIETVDIERFAHLVRGERGQWLWHGKPRKRTNQETSNETLDSENPQPREAHNQSLQLKQPQPSTPKVEKTQPGGNQQEPVQTKQPLAMVSKDDLDKVASYSDAKQEVKQQNWVETSQESESVAKPSTFHKAKGRLKEAVGLRNVPFEEYKDQTLENAPANKSKESIASIGTDPKSSRSARQDGSSATHRKMHPQDPRVAPPRAMIINSQAQPPQGPTQDGKDIAISNEEQQGSKTASSRKPLREPNIPDLTLGRFKGMQGDDHAIGLHLRRTQSLTSYESKRFQSYNDQRWPRQNSFSVAEDAVLGQPDQILDLGSYPAGQNSKGELARELQRAALARQLRSNIAKLDSTTAAWLNRKLEEVENLDSMAAEDVDVLNSLYYPRRDEYQSLQEGSHEVLAEERSRLLEAVKDLETMGAKLEYEINGLEGKVEDVESAVNEFESQVAYAEGRVRDLVKSEATESWLAWLGRMMLAMGRKPESDAPPKQYSVTNNVDDSTNAT